MKKLFTALLLIFCLQHTSAQVKWLPKFINKMYFDNDSTRHASFVALPVLSSAPEKGVEFGATGLYSFYTDTAKGSITRVSDVYAYASITTKGQTHFSLNSSYWTPNNTWHYTSSVSYINYPFTFYGIGNNTRSADAESVDEKRFKLDVEADKLVTKNLYIGIAAGGFNFNYAHVDTTGNRFHNELPVQSIYGGSSIFISPSITYDSRDNNTYTTKGMIVNAYYNMMHGIFGNNGYVGGFFNIEYSQFFSLDKKLVLGIDVQEQSLTGGLSPFYLLPALGSDEMMRGYYNGRYRDRNYIAGQTELRYRICDRLGLAGFVGTGEVWHTSFSMDALKPNYGGGVRYFFDTEKGLSIRLDYGVGQKPMGESRESGFYVGLGQAF